MSSMSPSRTNDLHAAHWPSLQPCMSCTPFSAAARKIVWSSSTSISMPTGSNRTTCFSPTYVKPPSGGAERCLGLAGGGPLQSPPPSPDPRSGVGRRRTSGRALTDVVGGERFAFAVAHLVQEHVRAREVRATPHVVQRPHLLGVEVQVRLRRHGVAVVADEAHVLEIGRAHV